MKKHALGSLIIVITLTLTLSSLGVSGARRKAGSPAKTTPPQGTEPKCPNTTFPADRALALLEKGNETRWTKKGEMFPRTWGGERSKTANCQSPFAVIVTCMDSRVPPELIFDQGLGDLFVIRVAGPVLNSDELASLEYALVKKNVKLVVVLGHTDCGAVKGAVDKERGVYLPELLDKLEPAIRYVSDEYNDRVRIDSKDSKNLDRVSIANAKLVSSRILSKPAFQQRDVKVTWGLYYTGSGAVAFEPSEPWLP